MCVSFCHLNISQLDGRDGAETVLSSLTTLPPITGLKAVSPW